MAVVRFSRDKRGYEHVYLIDAGKERGRSRLIYWFRTPPGVRVGRPPFDPQTQRALETNNPGVAFDWSQIVAARIPPPNPVEPWREKRRAERAAKRARATEPPELDTLDTAAEPTDVDDVVDAVPAGDEAQALAENRGLLEGGEAAPAAAAAGDDPAATATPATADASRGRRRRRRRGRRPAGQPSGGTEASPGDGGLDQTSVPPESSDE